MIDLWTAATPNGRKVSIALEEMGLPYTVHPISLAEQEQKEPWFLAMNPNGRIPVIRDDDAAPTESGGRSEFIVFESGAILMYLAEKTGQFLPSDPRGRSLVTQWLMFQMGGIGPMMGQANVFFRYAPEKIPYAIERYQRESRRLFEVLDTRLAQAEFLAGAYSIADMATWPWVISFKWSGVSIDGLANVSRWLDAISARPAVQRGKEVPVDAATAEQRAQAARSILA